MSILLEDRPYSWTNTRNGFPETGFDVVRDLFTDYVNLDDPKYKKRKKFSIAGSCAWLLIILLCTLICFVFIHTLWTKWSQSSLVIVNADKLIPVHQIPFPAVTVCLETKSKSTKYNFTDNYHLYNNSDTRANMSDLAREIFEDLTLVCDEHLNSVIGRNFSKPINSLTNLIKVAPDITDAFFMCKWKYRVMTCSNLLSPILTEEGICFTFNMLRADDIFRKENLHSDYEYMKDKHESTSWNLESGYSDTTEKDTYPYRGSGYGARMGLVFLVNQNKADLDYLCRGPVQGSKVLLHNPAEFPRISHQYFRTPFNQETIISIKPKMITTAETLGSYPPERRQCYYSRERYLHYFKVYTQSNCEFECLTNHTYASCGCVHIGMPRGPGMKVCNTGKVECMTAARNDFMEQELDAVLKQGKHCNCLPSCTSISYESEISQADYDFKALCEAYRVGDADGVNQNLLMSRVKLFFKSPQFIASERREMYGAVDFLADCGGTIGLFLGISLLGLIKYIYIIASRIYDFVRRRKRNESDQYDEGVAANISTAIN